MALDVEVGLGPSHIVLDGDTAPLPKQGAEPPNIWPIFGRPFAKRFALCYRSVVCLSCLVLSCLWRSCTMAKRLDESRRNLACR